MGVTLLIDAGGSCPLEAALFPGEMVLDYIRKLDKPGLTRESAGSLLA